MASPLNSLTESFPNGVRRFSRLLPDQVHAAPVAPTTVPKRSLAITLTHGWGVSAPPSSTIAYSRPAAVNPPNPFAWVSGGASTSKVSGPAPAAS